MNFRIVVLERDSVPEVLLAEERRKGHMITRVMSGTILCA